MSPSNPRESDTTSLKSMGYLSPEAMAEAAVVEASTKNNVPSATNDGTDAAGDQTPPSSGGEDSLKDKIEAIWGNTNGDVRTLEGQWKATMSIVAQEIDDLVRDGAEASQIAQELSRENDVLKDKLDGKEAELERLRIDAKESRLTIGNLLRSIETAKTETQDYSKATVTIAGLRADLSVLGSKYNQLLGESEQHKRKCTLQENEVRHVKAKLTRAVQDKIKMERDHRAALALSKNFDSHSSSMDTNYYKRKVTELNGLVQNNSAVINEKNRQIDDLRRQIERSMSQNRLANRKRPSI